MPYFPKIHMKWKQFTNFKGERITLTCCALTVEGREQRGNRGGQLPALAVSIDDGWDLVTCGTCRRSTKTPRSFITQLELPLGEAHG